MESRKGSRVNALKIKREHIEDEYETPRFRKLPISTHHKREETPDFSDTPNLIQKLHATSDVKREHNSPADYSHDSSDYHKPQKNKKEYKCNWSSEEDELLTKLCKEQSRKKNWKRISEYFDGKTDIQCMQRWEKNLNPENNKGKKRPWTEEEDMLVIKLVEKYGPQKWTFIADNLPGRIGKQCRERWHNHLNPMIKKTSWGLEEEWLLFLSHKAIGNKWADIAKSLPGRTDNSIKNHWNSSMKKRIPELLNRFQKLKEAGGLAYLDKLTDISKIEKELLETLFKIGDNDYHSTHGIITEPAKADEKENRGDSSYHHNSQSTHESYSHIKSPRGSATIKKLVEEIQFNPRTCDEIHKYIKEHNLDIPPIESLDLKNPSHLKLLDQLYNMKSLKSLLKHTQNSTQEDRRVMERDEDQKTHHKIRDPHSGRGRDQCSSCNRKKSSHHHNHSSHNSHGHHSKSHRSYHHYEKSSGQHRSESYMYYNNEEQNDSNSKNDIHKFINVQQDFINSPVFPKEGAYQLPSPNHHLSNKKEDFYSNFYRGGKREDDLFGNSSFNPDSYLFGSPLPVKKVKIEESSRNHVSLLDFSKQEVGDNREKKAQDKSIDIVGVHNENDENEDPNLSHNLIISTKNKGTVPLFLNSSASKENSHIGGFLFSPKPNKYESPSRSSPNSKCIGKWKKFLQCRSWWKKPFYFHQQGDFRKPEIQKESLVTL